MATPAAEVATLRGSVDPELWRVSAPSQAPAWEGLGGVKEALLLPALRNGSFASKSVTKQSFVTSGLGGEVAELAVSAVTPVKNAHVRSLRLNPPAPFYKGGIKLFAEGDPFPDFPSVKI
ncbi:hypothetical protein IH824_14950 [candidate division KSB1 bacterium]|nr:hypothetical protein [candidate division KSB1 bacterium]